MAKTITITIGKVEALTKRWLSTEEAQAYLGCSDKFLKTLRDEGKIAFSRYRNFIIYDVISLDRFVKRNTVISEKEIVL